jgi:hypothetical protein
VPFAYYQRLSRAQQKVYRRSDGIGSVRLPQAAALRPQVDALEAALAGEDRVAVQAVADRLLAELSIALGVPPLRTEVLAVRPARHWGELHGLYTGSHGQRLAKVTVWMRTAHRQQVVKFRTFLRTLLHELCHHLDYALLGLSDSFHTEGFYRRESDLLKQLLGERSESERKPHVG